MKKKLKKTSPIYEFQLNTEIKDWVVFENYKVKKYATVEEVVVRLKKSLDQSKLLIKNISENKIYSIDHFYSKVVASGNMKKVLDGSSSDRSNPLMFHNNSYSH